MWCCDELSAVVLLMCVQIQGHQKKKIKQMAKKELTKTSAMSEHQERQTMDVWRLSLKDRWRLYR